MTKHKRTSEIIQGITDLPDQGSMSVDYLTRLLGDRAFALAILVLALPNSLPVPGIPGFSAITGIPLVIIAWQMMRGREQIWLPRAIANKQLSKSGLNRLLSSAMKYVMWLECYLTPRWDWACGDRAERLLGALFLVLAFIMSLPIPGGNFLPGLSITLLALGLLEKDGLFVVCTLLFIAMWVGLVIKSFEVVKASVMSMFSDAKSVVGVE